MKKRNWIISGIVVTMLGTGLVFAGQKHRGGWFGHHGHQGSHMMHMIDKIAHRLDLSEQQVEQLEQIAQDAAPAMAEARQQHLQIGQKVVDLQPANADYDTLVNTLADEVAAIARQRTLSVAAAYKQASAVLTPEQLAQVQQHIRKRVDRMTRRHGNNG